MSDHDTWNMFAAAALGGMMASEPQAELYSPDWAATRSAKFADALLAESKKREPAEPTPPQPDDDGWIKWEGGSCPVPPGVEIRAKLRNGMQPPPWVAGGCRWEHHDTITDIVAYRVSEAGVTK